MKPLRSMAVEQNTLSSPLRILAVADGDTAPSLPKPYRGPITLGPHPHRLSHAPRTRFGYSGLPRLPL